MWTLYHVWPSRTMSSWDDLRKTKHCNLGCGKEIRYEGKTNEWGSTGFFETEPPYFEHTHKRCNKVKRMHLEHYKREDPDQMKLTEWYD